MPRLKRIKRRKAKERENAEHQSAAAAVDSHHPDNSDQVIGFWQWLKRNGFKNTTKLAIHRSPTFGLGIFTKKRRFKAGDAVMTLPARLLITSSVLRSYKPKVYGHFKEDLHCLIVFLMNELDDPESPWVDYFDVLPNRYHSLPYHLSTREISRQLGTIPPSLRESLLVESEKMTSTYHSLRAVIHGSTRDLYWTRADLLNWDLFEWAYCSVNTRCVYLPRRSAGANSATPKQQQQQDKLALVPFFDLLNHSPSADVYLQFTSDDELQLITRQPIDRFSQVFIKYNNYSNRQLLQHYGYTTIEGAKVETSGCDSENSANTTTTIWIRPSELDVIPLTYQRLHEWLQKRETSLLQSHISVFYMKRLTVLREIDFIQPTDNFELTWPTQAYFTVSYLKLNDNLTLFNPPNVIEEMPPTVDWRLDLIMKLMVCPKWDSAANIRRIVYSDEVEHIIPNENTSVWKQYYQLWIDLLKYTLETDYQGITVDGLTSFSKYQSSVGYDEVKAVTGNEIALLISLIDYFQQKLKQLNVKISMKENDIANHLENLSL